MRSTVTGKELPLLGGAACLDFVNTVDPRLAALREEFLATFEHLAEWGRFAGLLDASEQRAMLAEGLADPAAASAVHRRAIELREALFRLLRAPEVGSSLALGVLNGELQHTEASLSLARRRRGYELAWLSPTVADGLLGTLARSAAELLASPQANDVRECAGDGCGWLFLDTSKAHRRRWCSMAGCGNRAKARRHRRRRQSVERHA